MIGQGEVTQPKPCTVSRVCPVPSHRQQGGTWAAGGAAQGHRSISAALRTRGKGLSTMAELSKVSFWGRAIGKGSSAVMLCSCICLLFLHSHLWWYLCGCRKHGIGFYSINFDLEEKKPNKKRKRLFQICLHLNMTSAIFVPGERIFMFLNK